MISSLVLLTFGERLLLSCHHIAKSLTSSLYAALSPSVIKPTTVVSSENSDVMRGHTVVGDREYRKGLRTGVEGQCSGGVVAHPHHLGPARQKVHDPVVEGAIQSQGSRAW